MKLVVSPTTAFKSEIACPDFVGIVANSAVTEARLPFSSRNNAELSCSAATTTERFLIVEKMSLLWSPRMEKRLRHFDDGCRGCLRLGRGGSQPRVDEGTECADTARLGGL